MKTRLTESFGKFRQTRILCGCSTILQQSPYSCLFAAIHRPTLPNWLRHLLKRKRAAALASLHQPAPSPRPTPQSSRNCWHFTAPSPRWAWGSPCSWWQATRHLWTSPPRQGPPSSERPVWAKVRWKYCKTMSRKISRKWPSMTDFARCPVSNPKLSFFKRCSTTVYIKLYWIMSWSLGTKF